MKTLLLAAIRAYQRHVSPHKGYGCAYRLHTGHGSCSHLGFRAVRRYGVWQGLAVLRRRLFLCGVAHRRYGIAALPRLGQAQRGFCDASCDLPCDAPGCELPGTDCGGAGRGSCLEKACDWGDCCSGCDWPSRSRKQADDEGWVHIPPQRRRE